MLVGLVLGQADEDALELDDAAGDDGGVEPVAVVDQFVPLGVGVQQPARGRLRPPALPAPHPMGLRVGAGVVDSGVGPAPAGGPVPGARRRCADQIGRASCRERV